MPGMTKQAQVQKQEALTKTQSLTLMKNLIRTALSSIAYLRDLFPEDCFSEKRLTGVKVKTLLPESLEARLLIQWMEVGVFDALKKGYLDTMIFGIQASPKNEGDSPILLESYSFKVKYPEDESKDVMGMSISKKGSKTSAQMKLDCKEELKSSTVRMIRTLVTLGSTLKSLPTDRSLLIKLLYRDDCTPDDYEPQFFREAGENDMLKFPGAPMKIKIGTVETPFHEMSLKIKTVADSFGDDTIPQAEAAESYLAEDDSDDEEELDEDIAPTQNFSEEQPDQEEEQQNRPAFSREDPYGGILPVQNAPNPQEVDICESMNKFNLSASEGDNQSKSEYKAFVMEVQAMKKNPTLVGLSVAYGRTTAREFLNKMVKEGFLQKQKGKWAHVEKKAEQKELQVPQEECVTPPPKVRPMRIPGNISTDQELRRKRNRSSGAKFPTPLRKRLDTAELALDLSQNTEGYTSSGKRRKTSIVIEPILQGVTGDFPAPVLTKRHGWH